jgi:hypothetical protein
MRTARKFFGGKGLAVAAVVAGAVLACIAPVMAEVSADSPSAPVVRLESPAKLKAWGAAIEVQVGYTCPVNEKGTAAVNVYVSQAVLGGGIAGGYAQKELPCTGRYEIAAVNLQPWEGKAFQPGVAYGQLALALWPGGMVYDDREFHIVL